MQQNDEAIFYDEVPRESPFDDDLVAFKFIEDKRNHEYEPELYQSKWFDYRFMTPLQATRHYIQAYDGVYRRHYAQNVDAVAAKHVRTISIDGIFAGLEAPTSSTYKKAKSHLTACWFGRHMADKLTMPYEVYIDLAFEYRLRYWNRPYLPQPQHLYSDLVIDRVSERWPELQKSRLYTSDHPAYMVENFADLPAQTSYRIWLRDQALTRANPGELLGRFVNEDRLPLDQLQAWVTDGSVQAGTFDIARSYLH